MPISPGEPDGPVYGFLARDVVRVAEATRRVEATYRGTPPPARVPVLAGGGPIAARTKSGGITAGSIASPSSNTVTLLVRASSGNGLVAGSDVTCLNYSTGTVSGANKLIWLLPFNGHYVFPRNDC